MAFNIIVIIRIFAALLFLIAIILSYKIHLRKKRTTLIWLLILATIFIGFLDSLINVLEWAVSPVIEPVFDIIAEYTAVIFLIMFGFLSLSLGDYSRERILIKSKQTKKYRDIKQKQRIIIGILAIVIINLVSIFFFYT